MPFIYPHTIYFHLFKITLPFPCWPQLSVIGWEILDRLYIALYPSPLDMFYFFFLCLLPESKRGLCIVQCLIGLSFGARNLFDGIVHLTSSLPSCASYFLYNKYSTVTLAVVKDRFSFPILFFRCYFSIGVFIPRKGKELGFGWIRWRCHDALRTVYLYQHVYVKPKKKILSTETSGA